VSKNTNFIKVEIRKNKKNLQSYTPGQDNQSVKTVIEKQSTLNDNYSVADAAATPVIVPKSWNSPQRHCHLL